MFPYLTAARYRLSSTGTLDPRGEVVPRDVLLDEAAVDLHFVRFGLLRGRVTGDWDVPPFEGSIQVDIERAGGDGFYFERYLAPGRYRFRAPKGHAWAVVPPEVVVDLDHDTEVTLALAGYR